MSSRSKQKHANNASGSASEYGHRYRVFKISHDTFKTAQKMTNWAKNCAWFEDEWMHQQPKPNANDRNARRGKGKKKNRQMLKATIESKCKQRLKQQKKVMNQFMERIESASDEQLAAWSKTNCRGLKLSTTELKTWKEKSGYEMEGIMHLIGAETVGLQNQLGLSKGRWQALLSMHDQVMRGEIAYDVEEVDDGMFLLIYLSHQK